MLHEIERARRSRSMFGTIAMLVAALALLGALVYAGSGLSP